MQQLRVVGVRGVGADRLRRAAELDAEQLVERVLLDVAPAELVAQLGRAPHRHDGERLTVGEVEPLDAQHLSVPRTSRDVQRRALERELEHAPLGVDAALARAGPRS